MTPKEGAALASAGCLDKAKPAGQVPLCELSPSTDSSMSKDRANKRFSILEVKFTFLVDRASYKDRQKPSGKEMALIRSRLAEDGACVTVGIEGLESFIQGGNTIMPAICRGGTKKGDWVAQQLFFLDFDNDGQMLARGLDMLEPMDAARRAFDRELSPLLLYFSHSATIEPYLPKYRMVFGLSEPSADREYVESIGRALLDVFPEADPASVRPTQMFLSPGREVWQCWKML